MGVKVFPSKTSPVPAANSTANVTSADVIGNKADAAVYAVSATNSEIAYVKGLENATVLAYGVFTTDSSTAPVDTSQAALATDWCRKHVIMPLSGVCKGQRKPVSHFTTGTGLYAIGNGGFAAAPGLVAYVILSDIMPLHEGFTVADSHVAGADQAPAGSPKTITVDAKPAVADFTFTLTPPASPDSRLVFANVALRFAFKISTNASSKILHFEILNTTTSQTLLTDALAYGKFAAGAWMTKAAFVANATGIGYALTNLTAAKFTSGVANTIEVRLWRETGGADPVVLEAAGADPGCLLSISCGCEAGGAFAAGEGYIPEGAYTSPTTLTHFGPATVPGVGASRRIGSGSVSGKMCLTPGVSAINNGAEGTYAFAAAPPIGALRLAGTHAILIWSSVSTDLPYLITWAWVLEAQS